jgi:hypothetical protein
VKNVQLRIVSVTLVVTRAHPDSFVTVGRTVAVQEEESGVTVAVQSLDEELVNGPR